MLENKVITNDKVSLFYSSENGLDYCGLTEITSIEWGQINHESCEYCGQRLLDGLCKFCGAPNGGVRTGKALVTLSGFITARHLLDFRDNSIFEVYFVPYGRPDRPDNEFLLMRFSSCKMLGRKIENLTRVLRDDLDAVTVQVEIDCLIDVFPFWET